MLDGNGILNALHSFVMAIHICSVILIPHWERTFMFPQSHVNNVIQ